MSLIDFYVLFMSNVNVVDLMDLPIAYALFGDDLRFGVCCFFKSHLQVLW